MIAVRHQEQAEKQDDLLAYSIRDAAAKLGVSERHIQRLIGRGELASFKAGNRRLIARSTLVKWFTGCPN